MRALITGATGFIGQHLVSAATDANWHVRVLVRDPKRAQCIAGPAELWYGDLLDPDSLDGIASDIDVVFHLGAALSGPWERHRLITVEGTRRLLEEAIGAGVRRFVHVSSLAVYDKSRIPPDAIITEDSPLWQDLDAAGPYARGKIESERLVCDTAGPAGMEFAIVRPGLVYGPGHTTFEHLGLRLGRATFMPIGGSAVRLPLVHVDSVVSALLQVAEAPAASGKVFNIVDEEQASKAEYVRALSRTNCRRYRCIGIPAAPFTAAARATERARAHPRGAWLPRISADKIRARTIEHRYDCSALRQATSWRPAHALTDGLRKSFAPQPARRTPVRITRVGLIGAGRIADFHLRALRSIRGVEVVGILDSCPTAANDFARRFDIPLATNDPEQFYSARPQSVHILTPPHTHTTLALDAARRGVHVFLEKPAALTLDECDAMRQAADEHCITIGVDHNYMADPRIQNARRMIERSEIGDLVHIEIFWAFDVRRFHALLAGEPRATWLARLPGGPLEDLAPHPFSIALGLINERAQTASARAFRSGRLEFPYDDELRVHISGRRATASIAMSLSTSPDDFTATIYGTQRTLHLDLQNLLMIDSRLRPGPKAIARGLRVLSRGTTTIQQTLGNTLALALKRVEPPGSPVMLIRRHYEALAAGEPLPTDLEQARSILEIVRSAWPLLSRSPAHHTTATRVHPVS